MRKINGWGAYVASVYEIMNGGVNRMYDTISHWRGEKNNRIIKLGDFYEGLKGLRVVVDFSRYTKNVEEVYNDESLMVCKDFYQIIVRMEAKCNTRDYQSYGKVYKKEFEGWAVHNGDFYSMINEMLIEWATKEYEEYNELYDLDGQIAELRESVKADIIDDLKTKVANGMNVLEYCFRNDFHDWYNVFSGYYRDINEVNYFLWKSVDDYIYKNQKTIMEAICPDDCVVVEFGNYAKFERKLSNEEIISKTYNNVKCNLLPPKAFARVMAKEEAINYIKECFDDMDDNIISGVADLFIADLVDMCTPVESAGVNNPNAESNENMTIREYLENGKESDGWGGYVSTETIYNSDFANDEFRELADRTDGWASYVNEDDDGDLFVCGNENAYKQYFDDDVPMVEVVEYLIKKMKEDIEE